DRGRARRAAGPQRLALEVLREVGRRDLVEERRQAVVHQCLLVRARRRWEAAVLPRGDDVQGARGVILGRRRGGDDQEGGHEGQQGTTSHSLSLVGLPPRAVYASPLGARIKGRAS